MIGADLHPLGERRRGRPGGGGTGARYCIGPPRQPVHAGCGIAFEREERLPEQIHAEVVEERTSHPFLALQLAVRARAPVSREPSPVSGACFALPRSSWSPPLAPPAPQRARPPCSSVSPLLWRSVTSHDRASSATAPHLSDTDHSSTPFTRVVGRREISRVRTCQGLRPRRVFEALATNAPLRFAFRIENCVCTRDVASFAALWLAYALPCQRFAETLAGNCA